jgi:hypothetical protein
MPDEKRKHKLSAKEQLKLCALLSVGYSVRICADKFKEDFDIDISYQNIFDNYLKDKKWKKIIFRMAREAERRVLQHPLAKKVNRLNLLSEAANEALTWRVDKIYYDKDGCELSKLEKRNVGIIPNIIREARAEIEGDKALVDASTHHHLTNIYLPVQDSLPGAIRPEVKSGLVPSK